MNEVCHEASTEGLLATGVSARYGRHGPLIFEGLDLTVTPARVVGLQGPSGSGKSTLARVLSGLLPVAGGTVVCDGQPLATRRGRMSGAVGMLFQSPKRSCNPHMRLRQTILESRRHPPADLLAQVSHAVGLTPDLWDRLPAQVSLGQLQRACIARALVAGHRYLICDEATSMLDAGTAAGIARLLRQQAQAGIGVLAISHDGPFLAAFADDVLDLRDLSQSRSHPGVPAI